MIPPTVGVDPGAGTTPGNGTGIVAVRDGRPVAAALVTRRRSRTPVTGWDVELHGKRGKRSRWWCEPVEDFTDRVVAAVNAACSLPHDGDGWLVACEYVKGPSGFASGRRSPIDPGSLVGVVWVCAVVMHEFRARRVMPGGHGKAHRGTAASAADVYPQELVGGNTVPLAGHHDKGGCEDLWSAWDVAWAVHGRTPPAPRRRSA